MTDGSKIARVLPAKVVLVREGDGAQLVATECGRSEWLSGPDRFPGAKVGTRGFLSYSSSLARGRWVFSLTAPGQLSLRVPDADASGDVVASKEG